MDFQARTRLTMVLVMFLITSVSNASVGVLMYRFTRLRTVPNLLILSSCIADVLNQVFNVPGFAAGFIFKDEKYFVGRRLALAVSTFHAFFVLVNLMAMTLMMVDRLCALKFGIAYQVWRTKPKAYMAIAAKWISCLMTSLVLLIPIWDMDLGNIATFKYRDAYFSKRGTLITSIIFPFFIFNNAVVAIVTCSVIKHKNKIHAKQMGLKRSTRNNQTRNLNEIKAIKTISVTVLVFFIFYLPGMVYGIMERMNANSAIKDSWFGFIAYSFVFLPGILNPFIYAIRTRRFRRALMCFLKDPCGSNDISDKKATHKKPINKASKHQSNETRVQASNNQAIP